MMRWMLVGGMVGGGLWLFRQGLAIAAERSMDREWYK